MVIRKLGIITHYDVHNHGALLQLTALIRVLQSKGIQAKALQFDKNYDFIGRDLKAKYEISAKSLGLYLKYLKQKGLGWTLYNYRKRKTLNAYKSNQSLIGDYYSDSPILDCVIIGSDEVFALHTGPTPVFFGHCLPSDNVISYAGSFGPTTIEDVKSLHCESFIQSGLNAMKGISVRDVNSANVVTALTNNSPEIVVDPVLLYGFADEINKLERPIQQKYLLVYAYDNRMNSDEEVNAIKEYAASKNLKIISPGFYHKWCDTNVNVDPINLLAYFKYADEVITDTFHGSIMSIITGARFAVRTRESNHLKLTSLLNEYSLANRIFTDWKCLNDTLSALINYEEVNHRVCKRRDESMAVLNSLLARCI